MYSSHLISIVVPVYKSGEYLAPCIQSIISQTYTNWELILVDDGSPDNSGAICDEYAAKDSRIKAFHKENGGATSARRFGVEKANGEWIMFSDSDDVIPPHSLQRLYEHTGEDVDIIAGTILYRNAQEYYFTTKAEGLVTNEQYIRFLLDHTTYIGPCSKLIRKNLFNGLPWLEDKNIFNHEDLYMLLYLASRSKGHIVVDNESVNYICNDREGTISSRTMGYNGWRTLFENMYNILKDNGAFGGEMASAYLYYVTRTLRRMCINKGIWYPNDDFIEKLKQLYVEYGYPQNRQTKIVTSTLYRKLYMLLDILRKIR